MGAWGLGFSPSKQRSRCASHCKPQKPMTYRSMPKVQEGIHSFINLYWKRTVCQSVNKAGLSPALWTSRSSGGEDITQTIKQIIISSVISVKKEENGHQRISQELYNLIRRQQRPLWADGTYVGTWRRNKSELEKEKGQYNGEIPCSWTGRLSNVKKFCSLQTDL